jgi:hypothetical protein
LRRLKSNGACPNEAVDKKELDVPNFSENWMLSRTWKKQGLDVFRASTRPCCRKTRTLGLWSSFGAPIPFLHIFILIASIGPRECSTNPRESEPLTHSRVACLTMRTQHAPSSSLATPSHKSSRRTQKTPRLYRRGYFAVRTMQLSFQIVRILLKSLTDQILLTI